MLNLVAVYNMYNWTWCTHGKCRSPLLLTTWCSGSSLLAAFIANISHCYIPRMENTIWNTIWKWSFIKMWKLCESIGRYWKINVLSSYGLQMWNLSAWSSKDLWISAPICGLLFRVCWAVNTHIINPGFNILIYMYALQPQWESMPVRCSGSDYGDSCEMVRLIWHSCQYGRIIIGMSVMVVICGH